MRASLVIEGEEGGDSADAWMGSNRTMAALISVGDGAVEMSSR